MKTIYWHHEDHSWWDQNEEGSKSKIEAGNFLLINTKLGTPTDSYNYGYSYHIWKPLTQSAEFNKLMEIRIRSIKSLINSNHIIPLHDPTYGSGLHRTKEIIPASIHEDNPEYD